jgi:pyruvate/2-oxoglutarate dehydrogenase complex dihydrolipoamide acyltransferase (E2) component
VLRDAQHLDLWACATELARLATVRPVFQGGAVVARQMMNLSSSFDHRVVDGAVAAAFIQGLRERLEHPATLFIDGGA